MLLEEELETLKKTCEQLTKFNMELHKENERLKQELIRKDDALSYAVRSLYECARRPDYDD